MRRLFLLRHAKSDWNTAGARDHDRPLAPRGREAAPKMGAYMASHALIPDLVVSSTAARARETWDLAAQAFAEPPRVVYDERLYEVDADLILTVIKETDNDVHTLLIVGHNPALQELAQLIVSSGDRTMRRRLAEKFPTGGLVVIDIPVDDWGKLRPHTGRVDRFVVPRSLRPADT
jgi:phosphohistidine phosphatase